MGEKSYTHHQHEQDKQLEQLTDHEADKLDELISEKARNGSGEQAETLDDIRAEAQAEAEHSEDVLAQQAREDEPEAPPELVRGDLKKQKYSRTLQSIRKDLSVPERAFSKVVHNKVVDSLSAGAEKTVARPSALLAGSVCAFIGSSVFLYIAKHYGYEYNFLLFVIFFASGFVLGLFVELLVRLMNRFPKA